MIFDTGIDLYKDIKEDKVSLTSNMLSRMIKDKGDITSLYLVMDGVRFNICMDGFFKDVIFRSLNTGSDKSFNLFIDTISSNPDLIKRDKNEVYKMILMVSEQGTEENLKKIIGSGFVNQLGDRTIIEIMGNCVNYINDNFKLFKAIAKYSNIDLDRALIHFTGSDFDKEIQYLLDIGADPTALNSNGKCALELAEEINSTDIINMMVDSVAIREKDLSDEISKEIADNVEMIKQIKRKNIPKIKGVYK